MQSGGSDSFGRDIPSKDASKTEVRAVLTKTVTTLVTEAVKTKTETTVLVASKTVQEDLAMQEAVQDAMAVTKATDESMAAMVHYYGLSTQYSALPN